MKKLVVGSYGVIGGILSRMSWFPPLLARLSLGVVFTQNGWGKLHNIEKVADYFAKLGIPFSGFSAGLVATLEFACGLLLLAGLATRLSSLILTVIMVVALFTAKRGDIWGVSDLFSLSEYLFIVLFSYLAIAGPGPLSIDRIFGTKGPAKRRPVART